MLKKVTKSYNINDMFAYLSCAMNFNSEPYEDPKGDDQTRRVMQEE